MKETAFTFLIKGRNPSLPAHKRYNEGNRLEEVWGTYNNDLGSTGGAIDPECDNVVFAMATDQDIGAVIRVQTDIPTPGKFTITTVANTSGRWWTKVNHRKH